MNTLPMITRLWSGRRTPRYLQVYHESFQSERERRVTSTTGARGESVPSLQSVRSLDRGLHVASMVSHHRRFTISCQRMNKPPACHRADGPEIISSGNEKSAREHGTEKTCAHVSDSHGNDIAPLNQQATNAIMSQLSSPPNLLTLSRILATPYLSYLLISHKGRGTDDVSSSSALGDGTHIASSITSDAAVDATTAAETISTLDPSSAPVLALSLFLLLGFTDFLDGYIARTFPTTATVLGTYLDPFADKVFISMTSLALCYTGSLPSVLVGLWVARDVGMIGSVYWLVRKETTRKGGDENGDGIAVMDPLNTPLQVQASVTSKVNTTLQIGLIALAIAGEVPFIAVPPELMTSLIWITAGTTIGSSLGYLDGSALKTTRSQ